MKNYTIKSQNGAALAMGMVLLLIISIIGITSMKSALLQEKMSAGLKNKELADTAALSLMVEVERYLTKKYETSNGTSTGLGNQYIIDPHSDLSHSFRKDRNLTDGFDYINGTDINSLSGGILAAEPKFIIELAVSLNTGGGGGVYTDTQAEADDNSVAGGEQINTGSEMKYFKIVTKATDTTGHNFSAFESFISVVDR
jgi:Tfp pilus assembly protein PilX